MRQTKVDLVDWRVEEIWTFIRWSYQNCNRMLPVCGCRRGGRFSTDDLNTRSLFYWIPKIERDSVDILDWSQIQVYKPRSIRKCCGNSECSGGRCDRPPRINFGLHSRDIGGMFIQLNKRWYEKKNRYFILYSRCKQTRANNSEATSAWKLWIGWQLRYSFEWKKKQVWIITLVSAHHPQMM